MTEVWYQGRKTPNVVYRQRGDQPDRRPGPDGDPVIGFYIDPADAAKACRAMAEWGEVQVAFGRDLNG